MFFTKKGPATCLKLVILVLNENKISKPKRRGRAFETRGRVSCFELFEFLLPSAYS